MASRKDTGAIRTRLFSLNARGIKYDLDRMVAAAASAGDPQRAYPSLHVAGTNGKGSTCVYLESCLRQCGFRTGLFMSPHLVDFEERFLIDGRPVHDSAWMESYERLQPVIDAMRLTFFEAATLMAFDLFKRLRVEWAVFETGLGGRLDATNIVVPAASVITRLAWTTGSIWETTLWRSPGKARHCQTRHTPCHGAAR